MERPLTHLQPGRRWDMLSEEKTEVDKWAVLVNHAVQTQFGERKTEHIWPRDVLFSYLQTMEKLQNNIKEYQDLQYLAGVALHELYERRKPTTSPFALHAGVAAAHAHVHAADELLSHHDPHVSTRHFARE